MSDCLHRCAKVGVGLRMVAIILALVAAMGSARADVTLGSLPSEEPLPGEKKRRFCARLDHSNTAACGNTSGATHRVRRGGHWNGCDPIHIPASGNRWAVSTEFRAEAAVVGCGCARKFRLTPTRIQSFKWATWIKSSRSMSRGNWSMSGAIFRPAIRCSWGTEDISFVCLPIAPGSG